MMWRNFRYSPINAFGKAVSGEDVPSIWQGGTIGGIISKPVRTGQHPAMHLLIANASSGSELKNIVFNCCRRRQTLFYKASVQFCFVIFFMKYKICISNSFHYIGWDFTLLSLPTIPCCPESHLSKKKFLREMWAFQSRKGHSGWIYGWVKGMGRGGVGRGGCKGRGNHG